MEEVRKSAWKLKNAEAVISVSKAGVQYEQFSIINNKSDKRKFFKVAKRLKWENTEIAVEKFTHIDEEKLELTVNEKL